MIGNNDTADSSAPEALKPLHKSHFRNTRPTVPGPLPSPADVRAWLRYENHALTWRIQRGSSQVGHQFGTRRWSTFGGIPNFPTLEVAWAYHHGEWPAHAVRPANLCWTSVFPENLYLDRAKPSFASQL